jgi:hypothetical protein
MEWLDIRPGEASLMKHDTQMDIGIVELPEVDPMAIWELYLFLILFVIIVAIAISKIKRD